MCLHLYKDVSSLSTGPRLPEMEGHGFGSVLRAWKAVIVRSNNEVTSFHYEAYKWEKGWNSPDEPDPVLAQDGTIHGGVIHAYTERDEAEAVAKAYGNCCVMEINFYSNNLVAVGLDDFGSRTVAVTACFVAELPTGKVA